MHKNRIGHTSPVILVGWGVGGTCGPNGYITLAVLGAHMWTTWLHSHPRGPPKEGTRGGGSLVLDANYPPPK